MSDTLPIQDNPEAQRFEVEVEGRMAFAEYRLPEGSILFSHTAARERGLRVIPVCPFFVAWLSKHPDEADIVHPDYRRAIGL